MSDIKRLKKLAGLNEAELMSQEQQDDYDIARSNEIMAREKKVISLIQHAFNKLGLTRYMEENSIYYDEQDDRIATVQLDSEVPLKELCHLYASGLADEYNIGSGTAGISVIFTIKPELDNTV